MHALSVSSVTTSVLAMRSQTVQIVDTLAVDNQIYFYLVALSTQSSKKSRVSVWQAASANWINDCNSRSISDHSFSRRSIVWIAKKSDYLRS